MKFDQMNILQKFSRLQFLTICASILIFSSCGPDGISICLKDEGVDETRTIDLDQISGMDVKIDADVTLINAFDGQFIEITGPSNVIDRIETDSDISLGIWEMDITGCRRGSTLKVTAAIEDLEFLGIRGSGSYTTEETLETIADEFTIDVAGTGDMNLDLAPIEELDVLITGKLDAELKGETEDFFVNIKGTGDIQAHNLVSQRSLIEINGTGRVDVNAQTDLNINIKGTGSVCWIGDAEVTTDIDGTGTIEDCN